MTVQFAIAFAAFLVENENLLATALVVKHLANYLCPCYYGSTYFDFAVVVHEQHFVERNRCALLGVHAVDEQFLAGFYSVLEALHFYNCVHYHNGLIIHSVGRGTETTQQCFFEAQSRKSVQRYYYLLRCANCVCVFCICPCFICIIICGYEKCYVILHSKHKHRKIMKKKNLIYLSFVMFLLQTGTYAHAQSILFNKVSYTLNGTDFTAEVAKQSNTLAGDIVIPDTILYDEQKYAVTGVCEGAFRACVKLTSIELPKTLRMLGNSAFLECSALASCVIPDNTITKIGYQTFLKSGLTEFRVPEGVTRIEQRAFEQMSKLERLTLANSVTEVERVAFYNLQALKEPICNNRLFVRMPSDYKGAYAIPAGIETICNSAFAGCSKITSLTIPEGVKTIEIEALQLGNNSRVETLAIPASVENIAPLAINGGALNGISVAQDNRRYASWQGMLVTKNTDTLVCCPRAISNSITLPESIVHVADYACKGTKADFTLTNVKTIGEGAFSHNDIRWWGSNKHFILPETVDEIGSNAFSNSNYMEQVTIPSSVRRMGEDVFAFSSALKKATVRNSMIGKGQFSDCNKLEVIEIGDDLKEIGESAFHNCSNLWYVRMPKANDCYRAMDGVLYTADTTALVLYPPKHDGEEVELPEQVTTLKTASLRGVGLTKLVLPKNINHIDNNLFGGYYGGRYDCTPVIDTIVAPMMSVPQTEENPFYLLQQGKTVLLVPTDSLADVYRSSETWSPFDIHVDSTLIDTPQGVDTDTDDKSVSFVWPTVEGAKSYTLIIWADEEHTEKICTIILNSMGQLMEIDFSKHSPQRHLLSPSNVSAASSQIPATISFRYTNLTPGTDYWFTLITTDDNEQILNTVSGTFRTTGGVPTSLPTTGRKEEMELIKYFSNGQVHIQQKGNVYTLTGAEVK